MIKLTKKQLKSIIKEEIELLKEEEYDCIRDYIRMGYSRSEAQRMCGGSSSDTGYRYSGYRRKSRRPMSYVGLNDSTISDIENTLNSQGENLSEWEKTFLNKIHYQLKFKRVGLSPKQKNKVKQIVSKYAVDDDPDTNNDGALDTGEISSMVDKIKDDL